MPLIAEFKKFAVRGTVVDLAVGVIIGASFTGIITSLVNDVLMPPVGLALGGVDFSNFFLVLKGDPTLETLAAAKAAKAVTLNYGLFINAIINFLIVDFRNNIERRHRCYGLCSAILTLPSWVSN